MTVIEMKKEYKVILIGLCAMIASIGMVFFFLYRVMDDQTEKDVREIGRVFLVEKARQEANRFNAIKKLRFSQIDSMTKQLKESGAALDAEETSNVLAQAAGFQDLANCSLVDADGRIETVFGDPIERLGDESFLMNSLIEEKEQIVTGGWTKKDQLIIYASPLSVPMENSEKSIGLLWCKPMSFFISMMNLDDPESLAFFHIIRRDTSFVVDNLKSSNESYDELILEHEQPEGMTAEEAVETLHSAIRQNEIFMLHTRYTDDEITTRRSSYLMPLEDSNWYLLCILPYGVLDKSIADMGSVRMTAMLAALGILLAAILTVFFLYLRLTRKQVEALEAAREEAVAANMAKREFLSNMSHDIRTPMNAIVGMTAIAQDHIGETDRVKDCLKKIDLSSKQLLGLINDILDMSKIESGKMNLNMEAVSLKQTMETMCEIVRPQIKAKDQQFDIFISNILSEEVYCDSVRLNQVLMNFLSNAMKFTPEGGRIQIGVKQEESPKGDDYVRTFLSVSDNGMGMSEEFRKKLFTAFEREDNLRVQKTQGTGLGLTITKYIVDAMGGTIDLESEPGVGSTFLVTVDFEKVVVDDGGMKLPDWKVLVVDDNAQVCESASLTLSELGTRPETCMSGKKAVEMVTEAYERGEDYYVVLIDYKLSGMNGVETAKQIRKRTGNQVPISIISAYDWSDIEEEAASAGITRFISKPLFKSTLYYELKKYQEDKPEAEESVPKEKGENISGMRILLVEDNELNAEIATMILEESGCTVEHAADGRICLSMFEQSEPGFYDAILMDLRMPNMNGIEATERIRAMKRPDASKIPIIAMTADAFAEDAQKCREAGMNSHLAKPIDVVQLKYTLSHFVYGEQQQMP